MNIQEFRQKYPEYNDMSDQALADSLYNKHYTDMDRTAFDSQFLGKAAEPVAPPPAAPPTPGPGPAGGFGFQLPAGMNFTKSFLKKQTELPTLAGAQAAAKEYAPEIGLMGGSLIGLMAPPIAPITAGMGYAAGKMAQTPTTPVEDVTNLAKGGAYEIGGNLVGKFANKFFFSPFMDAASTGTKKGIEWLESKKLPFSADVGGGIVGKTAQGIADWLGFGRLYTNAQRRKLAEGLTESVGDIASEIGLPRPMSTPETTAAVSTFMQGLSEKAPYFKQFNETMKQIPETKWNNLLDAVRALGKRVEGVSEKHLKPNGEPMEMALVEGLKNIESVYGKKGVTQNIREVINNDGIMTGEEAANLINSLWRSSKGKFENMTGTGKNLVKRLKEGFMNDMETMTAPGTGETLRTIREAADKATHEALTWLETSPITGKFLRMQYKGNKKFYELSTTEHTDKALETLITPITKNDLLTLKQKLSETGQEQIWDSLTLAYLQKVFDKTVDNGVFKPQNYLKWYKQYGQTASEVMPELAGNLEQWANISQVVTKDLKRLGGGQLAGGLAVGLAMGGMEAARTGDYSKIVSVPASFSLIAALGTMGPGKLGFLRNYALKESSPIAAPLTGAGAKIGASYYDLLGGVMPNNPDLATGK